MPEGGPLGAAELDEFLSLPLLLIDEDARRHRRVQMTATAAVLEGPVVRAPPTALRQA